MDEQEELDWLAAQQQEEEEVEEEAVAATATATAATQATEESRKRARDSQVYPLPQLSPFGLLKLCSYKIVVNCVAAEY